MHLPKLTARSLPFAFLALTILAYGLLVPVLGFYWDDWAFAWIAKFLGPAEFFPAFAPFRPFLAPIFFITTSLLPPIPLVWQIFGLVVRFVSGLAAWWAFRSIWPGHKLQALAAGLFFLVFPGYSQQWVAFTHINQEHISLLAYLFSLGLTGCAFHRPAQARRDTALALGLLALALFPTEYFLGLEPLRFIIIWFLLGDEVRAFWPRLRATLARWWPYLLVWLANAAWLAYYYTFGGYASYGVTATQRFGTLSSGTLFKLLRDMGDALYKAGLYTWVQPLVTSLQTLNAPSTLLTLALIALTFGLLAFYLTRLTLPGADQPSHGWGWQALVLGLLGILLGRLPSWAAGLPLTLQTEFDRFMVSMMIGGSLFVAGLVDLLVRRYKAKLVVISLIVALAVGQQFLNANIFRRDWAKQQEIYWQLAWRIPALEPDTLLITDEVPLDYESDMGVTAPLNWIYAPNFTRSETLPYLMYSTRIRLDYEDLAELAPGQPVNMDYRTVPFRGSTSQAVVLYIPRNGCLRVLDPLYANRAAYGKFSPFLTEAIPLSDPSRIITDALQPNLPAAQFGREPEHGWCYYYEKAELARQVGDWPQVAALGQQAESLGYQPEQAFEWLPFIEAYAYQSNLSAARKLSRQALATDPQTRKGLCAIWERVAAAQPESAEVAAQARQDLQCLP